MLEINHQKYKITEADMKGNLKTEYFDYNINKWIYGKNLSIKLYLEFKVEPTFMTPEQTKALENEYGGNDVVPNPTLNIPLTYILDKKLNWKEWENLTFENFDDYTESWMGGDGDFFGACEKNKVKIGKRNNFVFDITWTGICDIFLMRDGKFPFTLSTPVSFQGFFVDVQKLEDADNFFSQFYDLKKFTKIAPNELTDLGEGFEQPERRYRATINYKPKQ